MFLNLRGILSLGTLGHGPGGIWTTDLGHLDHGPGAFGHRAWGPFGPRAGAIFCPPLFYWQLCPPLFYGLTLRGCGGVPCADLL